MATTKVTVDYKPDKTSNLIDLRNHLELLESVIDTTVTAPSDVKVELDLDYDDDTKILVASWEV